WSIVAVDWAIATPGPADKAPAARSHRSRRFIGLLPAIKSPRRAPGGVLRGAGSLCDVRHVERSRLKNGRDVSVGELRHIRGVVVAALIDRRSVARTKLQDERILRVACLGHGR